MMLIVLDISYLIDVATQLDSDIVGHGRYAKITSRIQKAITEGKDGMTRFLQTLWRRRREFIFDLHYPKECCFARSFTNWTQY